MKTHVVNQSKMFSADLKNFLSSLDLCSFCINRFTKKHNFEEVEVFSDDLHNVQKKLKPNICIACLGLFQEIDSVVKDVINNTSLCRYECSTLYSSVNIPISILIRDLSIWIELIDRFEGSIDHVVPPYISMKDAYKILINRKLCIESKRTQEINQNGILINFVFDYEFEQQEVEKLLLLKPTSYIPKGRDRKMRNDSMPISRNMFEKYFYPKNLDLDACRKILPVPSTTPIVSAMLSNYEIIGPTIFVAGRYRKLSRNLPQTPWILNGRRMKEDSLQELISYDICTYFGINAADIKENVTFTGSGREDIDVRCLGDGRPFVLQIKDSKKMTLPRNIACEMKLRIEQTRKVSVKCLQLINRDDLVHIKEGEEQKKKYYRALCILKNPVSVKIINQLNIPHGFMIQQKTPLRVLHRRPLLSRSRQIYSVKSYISKDHQPNQLVLDITTQAGAYIKELIHGEFGRTSPSISSIINQEIDIIALDVMAIDLDWPPMVNDN